MQLPDSSRRNECKVFLWPLWRILALLYLLLTNLPCAKGEACFRQESLAVRSRQPVQGRTDYSVITVL